ncbi:MAG TPA: hypothetical protein VFH51_08115, partial [Myxococcota bacterium]|nr:hypothetical protein [Myxococcota bacterium]
MSLAPAAAHNLLQLIDELAADASSARGAKRMQALALIDVALQAPRLAYHLVVAVLQRSLAARDERDPLVRHVADKAWAKPYPIAVQEYEPLLKGGPLLHLGLMGLLQQSPWPRQELRCLSERVSNEDFTGVQSAARYLQVDFAHVVDDADVLAARLGVIRAIKANSSMHVAQVEAYLAATQGRPSLNGLDAIDLGCGGGELVEALEDAGANAVGSELGGHNHSLLGVDPDARFDIVIATGLFEAGAFFWPGQGVNAGLFEERSGDLISAAATLLKPTGRLIVRNISYPI